MAKCSVLSSIANKLKNLGKICYTRKTTFLFFHVKSERIPENTAKSRKIIFSANCRKIESFILELSEEKFKILVTNDHFGVNQRPRNYCKKVLFGMMNGLVMNFVFYQKFGVPHLLKYSVLSQSKKC